MESSTLRKGRPVSALFDAKIVLPAIGSAFVKLNPRTLMKNPVMFVLEIVTALTTVILIRDLATGGKNIGFEFQIILWLWFTVLFANFAEAVAEGRGKAQAETLRRQRTETKAKLVSGDGDAQSYRLIPSTELKVDNIVLVEAGDIIPSDGEVIQGMASVNEAAITGELAPVIRESGGDRSAVTGGTQVLVRLDTRAHHRGARRDLPRPHDQARRRRRAAKDSQRDRAQHSPDRPDHHLRVRHRDDPELRRLCRQLHFHRDPGGAVRNPDPDHHRRAVVGNRHRRNGSAGAFQRPCHVGPRGRSRRRRRHAPARQDRDHHARQSAGDGISANARGERARAGRRRAIGVARRRDARRALDRRAGERKIRHSWPRACRLARQLHSVHRPDPDERCRDRLFLGSQGRRRFDLELSQHLADRSRRRRRGAGVAAEHQRRNRARGQHYRRRASRSQAARRSPSPRTIGSSASFSSRTSSRAASASASPSCAAWASARS